MTVAPESRTEVSPRPSVMDALEYRAPFVVEKLVKIGTVETAAEGEALFMEAKRYMVLVRSDETSIWQMHSLRVDEAWHQFILFTTQYAEFCQRYFGRYIHHSPSNAPEAKGPSKRPVATFAMFRDRYEELFGLPLPDAWRDERNVTLTGRLLNENATRLELRRGGALIELVGPGGHTIMSVNDVAHEALAFVCRTGAFHVRELPGPLTDDEKIALISALVECRVLRTA